MGQQNKKNLFVIGNGFDLASGIKSSYKDFKQWLKENNNSRLINMMDIFFSNKRDVWGDIEKALGEYDEKSILDFCKPDEEFDYDHITRSTAAVEDAPDWTFKPTLNDFIKSFDDWVNSINIVNAKNVCELPIDSKYLTFNYTETLEKVYGIPNSNILHIHGSRLSNKKYIIGHNNPRNLNETHNDESQIIDMQAIYNKIIEWMNNHVKDTSYIIHKNQSFFNDLSDIERVIVYGHSFYNVDWPYMEEIVKHVGTDNPWSISYHEAKDLQQIDSFVQKKQLKNVVKFQW